MCRHQIAQWTFKDRQQFTSPLDSTSQNPQQDCCGNLKCGIYLIKMAVSSSSVLSAHFVHTQRSMRNQTEQNKELFVGSRALNAPSAANLLHSNAAEGRYMT